MPRKMTRPEVAKRLAIRAFHEVESAMTHAQLVVLFGTSFRTVHNAMQRTVAQWAGLLVASPAPRKHVAARHPAPPLTAANAQWPSKELGSRTRAMLVPPDPEPDVDEPSPDVDIPDPAYVDEDNPDVDIPEPDDPRDPLDDPQPKIKKTKIHHV
jgi:hypothetical protein